MKRLTYGQANGLIILAGKSLGYNVQFEEQAETLAKGGSVSPVFLGSVDAEAYRIRNAIRADNRIDEANQAVNNITADFDAAMTTAV